MRIAQITNKSTPTRNHPVVERPANNTYNYPSYKYYTKKQRQKQRPKRYYPFSYGPRQKRILYLSVGSFRLRQRLRSSAFNLF